MELCVAPKSLDIPLFTCVEAATGERYWVRGYDVVVGATPGFTSCSAAQEVPPPPCFVGDCGPKRQFSPYSNCTEEQTKSVLRCGALDSVWDANCCRRPLCSDTEPCEPGFTCKHSNELFSTYPYAVQDADGDLVCEGWGQEYPGLFVCVPE